MRREKRNKGRKERKKESEFFVSGYVLLLSTIHSTDYTYYAIQRGSIFIIY